MLQEILEQIVWHLAEIMIILTIFINNLIESINYLIIDVNYVVFSIVMIDLTKNVIYLICWFILHLFDAYHDTFDAF